MGSISRDFWIIQSEIIKGSTSTYSQVSSEFNDSLMFWEYIRKAAKDVFANYVL